MIHFGRTQKLALLLADIALLFLALAAGYRFIFKTFHPSILYSAEILVIFMANTIFSYIFGGYDMDVSQGRLRLMLRSLGSAIVLLLIVILVNYVTRTQVAGVFGRGVLLYSVLFYFIISALLRLAVSSYLLKESTQAKWLILYSPDFLPFLQNDLNKSRTSAAIRLESLLNKSASEIEALIKSQSWSAIILAEKEWDMPKETTQVLMRARLSGVRFFPIIGFYELVWKKIPLYGLDPSWFVGSQGFNLFASPSSIRMKRLMDIGLSSLLILLTWPLMLLAVLAIKIESAGPILYRQIRSGKDGKNFTIFKFRSMRQDAEKEGARWASLKDDRITTVGNFLRKSRIDELPQLVNVLRGEMSFIGPRPERPEFDTQLEKDIPFYSLRYMVRPGLTGWAQVLYPYGASLEDAREKLQYDLFYIKNYSLFLDLAIVMQTVRVVLFGRGR